MADISVEASNFVLACEAIQALLDNDQILSPDDRDIIEFASIELLSRLKPPKSAILGEQAPT